MTALLRLALFGVLLGNTLTLITRVGPFHVYTVDFAILPFALLLLAWVTMKRGPIGVQWHWVDTMVIVNLALALVSFGLSDDVSQSVMGTVDWFRLGFLYMAFRLLSAEVIQPRVLVLQFALLTVMLVGLGLAQMVTGEPIGLIANYFGRDLDQLSWSSVGQFGEQWRVSGPTPNSNVFAMWVIVFGGLVAAHGLSRGGSGMLQFGAVALGMATVVLGTLSRGGGLGLVVFMALLAWNFRRQIAHAGVMVPLAAGLFGLTVLSVGLLSGALLPFLGDQFEVFAARGAGGIARAEGDVRIRLLQVGFQLLADPKVLLVGCGSDAMIEAILNRLRSPLAMSVALEASGQGIELRTGMHNVWMRMAVEYGVPAALAFASLFVGLWSSARRLAHTTEGAALMGPYVLAIALWFILVPSQVYLMAARLPVLLPLFLLLAYTVTRSTQADAAAAEPARQAAGFVRR